MDKRQIKSLASSLTKKQFAKLCELQSSHDYEETDVDTVTSLMEYGLAYIVPTDVDADGMIEDIYYVSPIGRAVYDYMRSQQLKGKR